MTDMDVNKSRFDKICAVVTTVNKSTSPIGFRGGSEKFYNFFFIIITLIEMAVLLYNSIAVLSIG